MKRTLSIVTVIAICATMSFNAPVQEPTGRLCLAAVPVPTPGPRSLGNPTGDLPDVTYSIRIDQRATVKLSRDRGTWVPCLRLDQRHSVVVLADQKPMQSFSFSFNTMSTAELCLFMEALYQTWRLSPLRQTGDWCSCGILDPGEKHQVPPPHSDDWAERFVSTEFAVTSQLDSVPTAVLSFLKEHCREELAAPGQPFNQTDVVNAQFPMRRFILAGNARSLTFVWYEHGGRGFHQHFLMFDLAGGEPTLVYHARPAAASLGELKSGIQERAWPNELDSSDEF